MPAAVADDPDAAQVATSTGGSGPDQDGEAYVQPPELQPAGPIIRTMGRRRRLGFWALAQSVFEGREGSFSLGAQVASDPRVLDAGECLAVRGGDQRPV
jgi:hypothetical protein